MTLDFIMKRHSVRLGKPVVNMLTDAIAPSSLLERQPCLLEIVFFRFHLSVSKDVVVSEVVKVFVVVHSVILVVR